jgi:hypothetical protein
MTNATKRTRLAMLLGLAALALALPRAAQAAEVFYGVTSTNTLITFTSDAPGASRTALPINGLQPGEVIHGIDVRPSDGQLYALGSSNRLYVIAPVSGTARPVGDPFSPPLAGTAFGVDFNPAVDRLRVLSDGRQNLRLNPENGAVAAQDNPLDYQPGDPNAGKNPAVSGAAYPADGKVLFGLDLAQDALVAVEPPNDGKLRTIGGFGVDLQDSASFDIAASGAAYVTGRVGGAIGLYRIDLAKGAVAAAARNHLLTRANGDVRAIAAAGTVPDDKSRPLVVVDVDRDGVKKELRRAIRVGVSCSEACQAVASVSYKGKTLVDDTKLLVSAGSARYVLKSSKVRALAKRKGTITLTLSVVATDPAGNKRRVSRKIRFV